MSDPTLRGLLVACYQGDRLARRALLDWLEESGDARAEAVTREAIDWDALVRRLLGRKSWGFGAHAGSYANDRARYRWYIDCARVGSPVMPEIAQAVRQARRHWLQALFPEVDLSEPE